MNPIESLVSISSYTELQSYRDRAYTCPTPNPHSVAFSITSPASHEKQAGHLLDSPKGEAEVEDADDGVTEEVKVVHKPDFLPQVTKTQSPIGDVSSGSGCNRHLLWRLNCGWMVVLLQRGDPQDDERDDSRRPDSDRPLPRQLDRQPFLYWKHCRMCCGRHRQSG